MKNNEEGNDQLVSADLKSWFPSVLKQYSEDDLEEAFKSGFTNCYNNNNLTFGEWFEQFQKTKYEI